MKIYFYSGAIIIFIEKGSVPIRRAWPELSDEVPIIIVKVVKGIDIILQKKKRIFYVRKNTLYIHFYIDFFFFFVKCY